MPEKRVTLLVIDDEPDMLRMLTFVLAMDGFEITTVRSGQEAVNAARNGHFDIALTDLKMPGMNGFETLKALKQLDPAIQVIVTTGYATQETAAACRENGAFELIRKPFDVVDLKGLLEQALDARSTDGER